MNKKNKIFYIVSTIIEIVLLIGAYMVNYFTTRRMGMLRHVIHKNYVWEEIYPITNIKYIVIILLFILMLLVLLIYYKRKDNLQKIVTTINITMVIVIFSFIGFLLIFSPEQIKAFYYISFILGVLTLVQVIKSFVAVIYFKKSK